MRVAAYTAATLGFVASLSLVNAHGSDGEESSDSLQTVHSDHSSIVAAAHSTVPSTVVMASMPAATAVEVEVPTTGSAHIAMDMEMEMGEEATGEGHDDHARPTTVEAPSEPQSYMQLPQHRGWIIGHIVCMVIAWFFLLPVGVMFGVAQSPFHVPVQLAFLGLTALGTAFAILYNSMTPDMYENNSHHNMGWVLIAMLGAQAVSGIIRGFVRWSKSSKNEEHVFVLANTEDPDMDESHFNQGQARWSESEAGNTSSGESQGTAVSGPSTPTEVNSPRYLGDHDEEQPFAKEFAEPERGSERIVLQKIFGLKIFEKAGLTSVSGTFSALTRIFHAVLGRPMFVLGYAQFCMGIVTYTGIFKGNVVFNGIAHFIKGSVFLLYGLLTLGRYLGAFANLGWAWNVKPPAPLGREGAATAEMVESSAILFYGATQSFMEHMSSVDGTWSHTDLQHVSIAFMFLWAGLCGVLFESKRIRRLLNANISSAIEDSHFRGSAEEAAQAPVQYGFSYNPMPALIVFATGVMMSAHHQASMISTMVHAQWGKLLAMASFFRLCTYCLFWLSPPKSYLPSRPWTEVLTSFCLICGGMIFMVSNQDTMEALESWDVDAMFVANLCVAASAMIMSWVTGVMALKGWAVKRRSAANGGRR
ncbi:hypothetical protein SAICODRAFT_4555 [Saitoella complicata NRRL Y-17804]|nr:uncharacterized protein SAICODRAFT_4555 [Saitoella complicata NRRL Y-17804]ODQ56374.1 hypothetical protein SAICODRAFT_4555 [Saitoella complicata NRRL Y-17804]